MFEPYSKEATIAIEAVQVAAQLCRKIQRELVVAALSKSDRSPVTVADFASQAVVAHRLEEVYPMIPLVAEEDSTILKSEDQALVLETVHEYVAGEYPDATQHDVCEWIDWGAGEVGELFWTLDPIDGTKGFLRGDQYVVALALVQNGQVVLGAMACPNLDADMQPDSGGSGSVVIAVHGGGAWVRSMTGGDFRQMMVSDCRDADCLRMLRSFESSHTDPAMIDAIASELRLREDPVLMDSAAKYGLLAGGQGELIIRLLSPSNIEYAEKIWDHAAGSLVVEEAGGRITDLGGKRLDFSLGRTLQGNIGVLASNGPMHDSILSVIAQLGADQR
jgi:3'(2'), 5'-bisphosphate nucleotidase